MEWIRIDIWEKCRRVKLELISITSFYVKRGPTWFYNLGWTSLSTQSEVQPKPMCLILDSGTSRKGGKTHCLHAYTLQLT